MSGGILCYITVQMYFRASTMSHVLRHRQLSSFRFTYTRHQGSALACLGTIHGNFEPHVERLREFMAQLCAIKTWLLPV